MKGGEWGTIPYHLHTADITKPFKVVSADESVEDKFDIVTAWEVLEHIEEKDLDILFDNITRHLSDGGYFICSIAFFRDENLLTQVINHKTLKSKEWWENYVENKGLKIVTDHPFQPEDMVIGNGIGLKEWHPEMDLECT